MPQTGNDWKTLDVPVTLAAGSNRLLIEGLEPEWNSVQLDTVQIIGK
jgi:hypothetical protein